MAAPKGMKTPLGVCGIYRITSPSGRVYIGQAVDIGVRFQKYFGGNCPGQRRLHASFAKHGVENHTFEVVEICEEGSLSARERFHQDNHEVIGPRGLNCKLTTFADRSGAHSEETRNRIRMANTGKRHSAEAKAKMRLARIGRKMPGEQRLRMCGRKLSEATKQKMSARMLGNKYTTGVVPKNARKVINRLTGEVFCSTKTASEALGVKQRTLRAWLSAQSPNKSTMEFL